MHNGRLHGGVVVSTVASEGVASLEGSRFNSWLGPFCVEFACSPRVCVGSLRVVRLPPTVQKHMHVRPKQTSFVSVWPCDRLVTSDPTDGLSGYRKWMDGWMEIHDSNVFIHVILFIRDIKATFYPFCYCLCLI